MDPVDPNPTPITASAPAHVTPATTVIYDRRRELRVKIKSLAQEARIIRSEEQRCRNSIERTVKPEHALQRSALEANFARLRLHRIGDVRRESRYSLLAYAIIRGRQWAEAERSAQRPDPVKLGEIVARFGWCSAEKAAAMVAAFLAPGPTAAVDSTPTA